MTALLAGLRDRWTFRRGSKTQGDRQAPPWERPLLVLLGAFLLILGLYLFGMVQTQALFRASAVFDLRGGLASRNDGGILMTALMAGLGLAMVFTALSRRERGRRWLPATGLGLSSAALLVIHFSFFVNGILMEERGQATMEASFLFHDASILPLAVHSLALFTLLLIATALFCAAALIVPETLRNRIMKPTTLEEHRTRMTLVGLVFLAGVVPFGIQFFRYAFEADGNPTGGFITTNLIALYYILSFLVMLAAGLATWRAWVLVQGNTRFQYMRAYRRNLRTMAGLENWVWGTILLLNIVILNSGTITSPTERAVFTMDSRGASMSFFLIIVIYMLHRYVGRALLSHIYSHRSAPPSRHYHGIIWLAVIATTLWALTPHLLKGDAVTPLIENLTRCALITVLLFIYALRLNPETPALLHPRNKGTPQVLLLASAMAILTGIMLWGAGNSVLTMYSRPTGGFLTPESRYLQPYTVLFRILGAAFIALPVVINLWLMSARKGTTGHPGHLLMTGLGAIVAINLLFTIQPADILDAALGQTDVRFGFYILQINSHVDRVFMTVLWLAATIMSLYAAGRIVAKVNQVPFRLGRKAAVPAGG